jgi:hypothetical protein
MSDSSNIKLPGGFGVLSSAFNLMRATIDASDKTTPKDQVLAFKSPILDLVGGLSTYFKPCSTLAKAMPFVGKAVSINDGRMAWNNLQAERSNPEPDSAKIKQFQRDLFVASADTISPILPVGTMISTTVDVGTYMVKNPQLFTDRSPMSVEAYREHLFNSL